MKTAGLGFSLVLAPPAEVVATMPYDVATGESRLEVAGERMGSGALPGHGTRRFKAYWSTKGWRGEGSVEIRPASSSSAELVVQLDRPSGPVAHVWWDRARLARVARSLARTMRDEIERAPVIPPVLQMVLRKAASS